VTVEEEEDELERGAVVGRKRAREKAPTPVEDSEEGEGGGERKGSNAGDSPPMFAPDAADAADAPPAGEGAAVGAARSERVEDWKRMLRCRPAPARPDRSLFRSPFP